MQKSKTSANKCPEYDTKQSGGEVPVMLWRNAGYSLIATAPRSTLVAPDKTKLRTYPKLNCLK